MINNVNCFELQVSHSIKTFEIGHRSITEPLVMS